MRPFSWGGVVAGVNLGVKGTLVERTRLDCSISLKYDATAPGTFAVLERPCRRVLFVLHVLSSFLDALERNAPIPMANVGSGVRQHDFFGASRSAAIGSITGPVRHHCRC